MKNEKNRIVCLVTLSCIAILMFFVIRKFAYIEDPGVLVPTGNVDIFEIGCSCHCDTDNKKDESGTAMVHDSNRNGTVVSDAGQENIDIPKTSSDDKSIDGEDAKPTEPDEETLDFGDVSVYDDAKVWDNYELKIFSNPAYQYQHIIAPGSSNSYAFVIRNNNEYSVKANIVFDETNYNNINMRYKLKNNGEYLIGLENSYDTIKNKKISIELPAKSYESYVLDWKWVDSDNDAEVGFDANSIYKLMIRVMAR